MEYIFFLITFFLILVIGKFIYDSYLTNNTENRWDEHQQLKRANVINKNLTEQNEVNSNYFDTLKKELVITEIENELYNYQINNLKEIENEFGVIKGNMTAVLLATEMITENTETFKIEFVNKQVELGLSEKQITNIIEDITRKVIDEKLGVDLEKPSESNLTKDEEISRYDCMNVLRERPFLSEGLNQNIVISKIDFEKYSGEALVYIQAMNKNIREQAQEYFADGEYSKAADLVMKKYVNNELAVTLDKYKLASVYGVIDNDDIVIGEIIPQNVII